MSKVTEQIEVEVHARKETGKNANRRLRAGGMVPGNVYGLDLTPFPVTVSPRRVEEILRLERGRNTIFRLRLAGADETREVMLRELQRDPVSERLVHVDFVRVDMSKPLILAVPVNLEGIPEGVRTEGGVMDFVQRTVQISCLPGAIPEYLTVDVTELHVNQNVAIKDLETEEGITILDDPESILAVVAITRAEVSADEEGAEDEEEGEGEGEGDEETEGEGKGKEAEGDEKADKGKD